jgi:alkylation response protein AidB-like acyl-CoA dehydrogenase
MLELTDQQKELIRATRDYADRVIRPAVSKLDNLNSQSEFPFELMREGSALGLKSIPLPPELGGINADMVTQALVVCELAAADVSVGYFFRHYWRFARLIPRLPDAIRTMVVEGIRHDEKFVPASASTESAAGSDNSVPYNHAGAGAMLRSERDGNEWVLNGEKYMITNGSIASLYFVLARTDPSKGVVDGCTMFAVPANTPGFTTGPRWPKMGQRGSPQADLFFKNVRIPEEYAITKVGEGYAASERGLIAANITNAGMCLGVAREAYELALEWCANRVQGGQEIYKHQLVAHDLGRMKTLVEATRSHLLNVAWRYSYEPTFHESESWQIRVLAADTAIEVTQKALFLFGGRGMMQNFPIEKLVRDALTLTHGNGTSALMTMKIGLHEGEKHLEGVMK